MLVTAILCVFIGLSAGQTYPAGTCGLRPLVTKAQEAEQGKIVGGTQAIAGDWPWSCSMLYSGSHRCGGSLISDKWIVSAAHCSTIETASNYVWECGVHDRGNKEQWVRRLPTKTVVNHPKYNSRLLQNDISLFELTTSAAPFDQYIMPACFPDEKATYENAVSWATGWGSLNSGGSAYRYQMQVQMPILTDAACKTKFGTNLLPASQVCAGVTGGGKDTCQGDSGGPLVVKQADGFWYLIGLTSWGYGCGDGGVYTRTSAFRTWVEGYTGKLSAPIAG